MAIGTNSVVENFGTQVTVTSSSASLTDGSYSGAGDVSGWVNSDNVVMASVTLQGTFSVAPDANSAVALFAVPQNVFGTNDQAIPTANFMAGYVGAFPVNAVTTEQFVTIDISLSNAQDQQEYVFVILNDCGQTLSAGWNLHVTPKAIVPKV